MGDNTRPEAGKVYSLLELSKTQSWEKSEVTRCPKCRGLGTLPCGHSEETHAELGACDAGPTGRVKCDGEGCEGGYLK